MGIPTSMAQGRCTKMVCMIKWIRTSRLTIKSSLSLHGDAGGVEQLRVRPAPVLPNQRQLISQKVFVKSFFKSQFPHKCVNFFFMSLIIQDTLTDLCGNRLLKDVFMNTSCEIRTVCGGVEQLRVRPTPVLLIENNVFMGLKINV